MVAKHAGNQQQQRGYETVNAYLYSLLLNAAAISGMCLMGRFVWKGASTWLVLVAFLFSLAIVVPSRETFTCPKCGHTGTLSV